MSLLRAPARPALHLLALAFSALLLIGLLVTPSGRAFAAEEAEPTPAAATTTWSVQPANGEGADGRVSLRHQVDPGQKVDDHIAVTNFSDRPAKFLVYASDGVTAADGSFDVLASTDRPVDGGSWITLGDVQGATKDGSGRMTIEVAPASALILPLSITVPGNATPGDHPAGVVAELVSGGTGITVSSRVGVRAHLRVTGDVKANLAPEITQTQWEPSWNPFAPGTLRVTYRVENAGNIRLGATATPHAAGPFGMLAADGAPTEITEVLPGKATEFTTQLSVAPLFFTTARITVVPTIVGQDQPTALTETSTEAGVWTIPWAQLIVLLLIAALVWLWLRRRRRNASKTQEKIDAAVAAALSEHGGEAAAPEAAAPEAAAPEAAAPEAAALEAEAAQAVDDATPDDTETARIEEPRRSDEE